MEGDALNILYHPQLSMRSYEDNRWLVSADAQFTKILAYVKALPQDWSWTFLMPEASQADTSYVKMLPGNVDLLFMTYGDNVLENRYNFDVPFASSILRAYDFDVLLLEVPEHARAWRVVQQYAKKDFPIISMVEHVDFYEQTRVPEKVAFHLRQLDGALVSDAVAFPLQGMSNEWAKASASLVPDPQVVQAWSGKCTTWDAIYSPDEVSMYRPVKESHNAKPVINFISRLSDNQRTHYEEFFEACRLLEADGREFEVWVANPNEAMTSQRVLVEGKFVTQVGNLDRKHYMSMLWQSDIVPILYPQSHIYSLGFCEAIVAENLMLTQTPLAGWPSYGIDVVSPANIALALDKMLHVVNTANGHFAKADVGQQLEWLHKDRSVEANIDNVEATILAVTG